MKTKTLIYAAVLSVLLSTITLNCKKEAEKKLPSVSLAAVTGITATSASSGGEVTTDGGDALTARGVCWSTNQNPTITDAKTNDGTTTGGFTSLITGLTQGTTYYIKAYATNSIGTGYSSQSSFTTQAMAPVLSSNALTGLTSSSVTAGGNITSDGGSPVTSRGVCWSISTHPTIADNKTTDGTGTGGFTSSVTGLTPGTSYYLRAYATNSIGTSYGNELTFATPATLPFISTATISAVTSTSASGGGNVTGNGGAPVTARGVCWSTTSSPTTSNNKTSDGSGSGSFTSSITGLTAATTYYVRAYATNIAGTSYGNELTITTAAGIVIEWVSPGPGEIISVFHYANGVQSGETFFQKFNVLNESGEVSIVVQDIPHGLSKTAVFSVEKDRQYKLSTTIDFTSQSGIPTSTKCQTFVLSSPTSVTTKEFYLMQVMVQVGGPYPYSYPVCPGSVSIGNIGVSIIN